MSRLPAAQRREQLLDQAALLFARKGYARTTTAELAKASGITEPIIYRHFQSKKDLFVALIDRSSARTIAQWEKHLNRAEDPARRIIKLVGDNPMVSPSTREDYRVLMQAITEIHEPEIKEAVARHIKNLHSYITREIARAQEEHKVGTRFSAEMIGWLLIHLGMGYGALSAMEITDHGVDANGVHVEDVIARLLVGKIAEKA